MDNQLILIITIVLVIIGVALLIWRHSYHNRGNSRKNMAKRTDPYTDDYFDENKSEPPVIDDIVELKDNKSEEELAEYPESIETPILTESSASTIPTVVEENSDEPSSDEPSEDVTDTNNKSEMLVVLYVVARRQPNFNGEDILTILEKTGVKYGKMDIFHHYGIGETKTRKPVFSVANIVAPGTLVPQELAVSDIPGLALFMRLPGPFGGRVAFELMLNNAERFAEALDGIVEDEQHKLINQQKITVLRERIANFEQRTVSLTMLKQFS
ncbi:cell division protein ZipA [Thiotrichales bacterium HSG1]|nr:cell division protein ZipA [Thiotrichales bacterium HSG1]